MNTVDYFIRNPMKELRQSGTAGRGAREVLELPHFFRKNNVLKSRA